MRNYTKPSAEVVELAVKEPVSLTGKPSPKEFGFGSKTKTITLTTFSKLGGSDATATTQALG